MDARNLQVVLYPTLLRPDFQSLQNISQNMNMGLFIQTCIEQTQHIFDAADDVDDESLPGMVEAPSTSSLAQNSNNLLDDSMSSGEPKRLSSVSTVLTDGADTGSVVEQSFSDSVLHDPNVEIIISSPSQSKAMRKASVNSIGSTTSTASRTEKRKSIETTI